MTNLLTLIPGRERENTPAIRQEVAAGCFCHSGALLVTLGSRTQPCRALQGERPDRPTPAVCAWRC